MALTRTTMTIINTMQTAMAAYRGPSRFDLDWTLGFVPFSSSIRPAPGSGVFPKLFPLLMLIAGVSVGVMVSPVGMVVGVGVAERTADTVTMEFVSKLIEEGNCL